MRNCSYNPENDMIRVTSFDGKEKTYLEVRYRVRWFHEYCDENGILGRIDDSDVRFVPEAGLLIATAAVYMNDKEVGKSAAGICLNGLDPLRAGTIVQTIATQAKGRALANAGFGTISAGLAEEEDRHALCDAGMPVRQPPVLRQEAVPDSPAGPMPGRERPEPAAAAADAPVSEEAYRNALVTVIPTGSYKGKTFQEALGENPGIAKFYATRFRNPKYPEIRNAAVLICRYQQAV